MTFPTKHKLLGSLFAVSILGLAACQEGVTSSPATVDRAAFAAASTPAELEALGAQPMSGAEIRSDWAGGTHDAGDWTFTINADGTWSAEANDGSWSDGPGTWEVVNNQFCREAADTARECQTIYRLGNHARVSPDGATLRPWTVTL